MRSEKWFFESVCPNFLVKILEIIDFSNIQIIKKYFKIFKYLEIFYYSKIFENITIFENIQIYSNFDFEYFQTFEHGKIQHQYLLE